MKIGFDAKRLFNNFTGLGNYSRFVADALTEAYPDNEYLLYTPKVRQHIETQKYLGAPYQLRQPRAGANGSWWRTFSIKDDLENEKLDVYHGLSNELPFGKPKGVKTVVTVHDLIFMRFPEYYGFIDVNIYKWKLARACKTADAIVAVSNQTATDLKDFLGVDEKKIVVVHQGCHPSFYRTSEAARMEEVRSKYQLPKEFILFVGTLEKRKNAGLIIKALSVMKNPVPLVLVGRATKYVDELNDLVRKHHLEDKVKMIHNASFADLPELYKLASLFVYPSVFEGFGIPIVEAIASGVPVISSNGSCFSEAGGPHCLYVNPSNFEELSDNMRMVLENSSVRTNMIDGSRQYIQRFAPEVIGESLMKVYASRG